MDYSSYHEDSEHASGASPWAASSPRRTDDVPDRSIENDGRSSPTTSSRLPPSGSGSREQYSTQSDDRLEHQQPQNSLHGYGQDADRVTDDFYPAGEPTQIDQSPQSHAGQGRGQPGQRQPQQRYHGQRPGSRQSAPQYRLQAKVTGLERSGRKDPILRFDVYTNLPGYRTTQFRDVRRTHAEFTKLAQHLISANPQAIVPAVPPASTPAGVGTDEDEARVKTTMQRWLTYVCGNDVLMRDEEIVRFVEGDPGYSPVIKRSQPATGVRRKMLKQFAPPPDDTPELQDARPIVKLFYLGTMDASQKVDKVVKHRRGLGLAETELGTKIGSMMEQEPHPGLKNAFRKLGRTIQTTGDLHAAQGTAEATTLGDPLSYHSADAFIVKETLTNRHILLRELTQAQQATRSKLSATDRLKASSSVRRDKVDEAIAALDQARSQEAHLFQTTQAVTSNLVQERRRWFTRTAADLRASIREYVVREIEAERRTLATLEAIRPDIRAIDASGGLSRLGREAHPAARRATLMSSQGPKGDAWSGVPRRQGDGLNRSISGSFVAQLPGSEEAEDGSLNGEDGNRARSASGAGSLTSVQEDLEDDRVDARNAASRLATSTF